MSGTVTLKKPVKDGDKTIKEVVMDLDGLTGKDLAEAERTYLAMGGIPTNLTSSVAYLQHVAARACGISIDAVRNMNAKDCAYLVTMVQVFLLDMDFPSPARL